MTKDTALRKMKILYVEDDDKVSEELVPILKRRCSRVVHAADGAEGIEEYEKLKPDIVLADLLMPNMNGTEMIEKIRREHLRDKFAVVILTALSDQTSMLNAVNAGIDRYIMKPVDVKLLLDTLDEQAQIIYQQKYGLDTGFGDNPRLHEDEIKRDFAALLKTLSGKGPKNVSVSIGENTIDIIATEVLTTMEKTIISGSGNAGAVRYSREVFFYSAESDFTAMLQSILGRSYQLSKALVSTDKNRIKLSFIEIRA